MDNQLYSQAKKLHAEGLSSEEISKKLGLSGESRINNEEVKQTSMLDDLRMTSELLQEIRKRLCDIGKSTGCMGCMPNDATGTPSDVRTEIGNIVECATNVLNAVRDLQSFIG